MGHRLGDIQDLLPEIILPSQLRCREKASSGVRKLLMVLLGDAFDNLEKGQRLAEEARAWFEQPNCGGITLQEICDEFDLNLEAVQAIARARYQRARSRRGPPRAPGIRWRA